MTISRNVFEQAFRNIRLIPRSARIFALNACGALVVFDVLDWATRGKVVLISSDGSLSPWFLPLSAILIGLAALRVGAVYLCAVGILRKQRTLPGYLRFALTSAVLFLPLQVMLLYLVGSIASLSQIARLGAVVAITLEFIIASLLVAWPMAQSLSARFVSPLRVFRATKGQRWPLFFLGFLPPGISNMKIIPPTALATNAGEALMVAIGHGLLQMAAIGLTAGIAAAAWDFAAPGDPSLDPTALAP